ncbi:MAG: 3-phosphoshikimate 1-carboxyvinyltransferase [Thermoplasmata archaeon]
MTEVRVSPGPVHGTVRAPPSKSYTHRALVVAHLAGRRCAVERPLRSNDTLRTVAAIRALGSVVTLGRDRWTVAPSGDRSRRRAVRIDCGESGTTLRFASALAALESRPVELRGRGRLPLRPMGALSRALRTLGATVKAPPPPRTLPMVVRGPVRGGEVEVDASESSQFVSALLLALPTAEGDSVLRLPGPPVSAPYIDATVAVMRASRVRVTQGRQRYRIPGHQIYRGRSFRVPGDASSAAYLWAAPAIAGGSVTVLGLPDAWPQADLAILGLLREFGARVQRRPRGTTVEFSERRPFRVELTDSPDLYPLAGVLAASARGVSTLVGAAHVASKESDRRAETIRLATQMGAKVRASRGGLRIEGTGDPTPLSIRGADDHRIVMSAAIGALAASGASTVGRPEAVAKSFPEFWSVLAQIAGKGRIA